MCGHCDEYKDADIHGCFENPKDPYSCICDKCDEKLENQSEIEKQ